MSEQPSLGQVAREVGLSEFHFQRLFQRWAGVSPKRFLQFLTLEEAKRLLQETHSLLETSFELGLSGPSRLHDLFLSIERMTPGQYKAGAQGVTVRWGVEDTLLGPALFAAVDRGLCGISFVIEENGLDASLQDLSQRWPSATLKQDPAAVSHYAEALQARMSGHPREPLSVVLKGTSLQLKVWEALLRIPAGRVVSYGDVAKAVGLENGSRAVGAAVGQNPIAWLIPCHRVIYSTGSFGNYRWGAARKAALLGLEMIPRPERSLSSQG
jgi:AraC family transcriptional regulator of adaptative response/methylated-DNA-[protein]-cysteine methyltransferase